jgi:hypothetical protein
MSQFAILTNDLQVITSGEMLNQVVRQAEPRIKYLRLNTGSTRLPFRIPPEGVRYAANTINILDADNLLVDMTAVPPHVPLKRPDNVTCVGYNFLWLMGENDLSTLCSLVWTINAQFLSSCKVRTHRSFLGTLSRVIAVNCCKHLWSLMQLRRV